MFLLLIELWRNKKDFFGHPWPQKEKKPEIDTENKENLFLPRLSIKLNNFEFYHTASTSEYMDKKYIRRLKFEHKLKSWLTEESGHGVYLITGHRGTGKSSLVGTVIKDLKDESRSENRCRRNKFKLNSIFNSWLLRGGSREKIEDAKGKKYVAIYINIGQDNINEIDFFRVLTKTLREELAKAIAWKVGKCHAHPSWYMIFSELKRFGVLFGGMYLLGISFLWRNRDAIIGYWTECFFWGIFWVLVVGVPVILLCGYLYENLSKGRAIMHLNRLCAQLYAVTRYKSGFEMSDIIKSVMVKEREMPPLSAQAIAYELVSILDILKNSFSIIIVLDELDKVDKVDKESEPSDVVAKENDIFRQSGQYAASQVRRQRVLAMIANMKYFLSTAKAYFVFIAGPELYEAAMADISDRDFAIGNLFNGILSVDSFYTKGGLSEAIALTEEFVCKQIDRNASDLSTLLDKQCIGQGQIIFLYHFICYLAFISHGSPKKITMFFEKYVRSYQYLKRRDQTYDIDKNSKDEDWYLTFSDHQQMKINFVHYLAFPILQNIMNNSDIFGDKLRVAESFIFAHIVKLHNSGFSWRNIEQIPEIMSINRAPEVREYIQAILMSMQQTLIKPVVCGLYAYKFPLRMAEEISYFSKLSDELSALLNFSTGELQPIKEHYYALLDRLPANIEREKTRGIKLHMCEHIYVEASIRHALGDIYMQEENFSAAIRQFERCVELVTPLLIKPGVKGHRQLQNYVLFYYRTMLKLGLAHEKRHTDNSAYTIYNDLLRVLFEVKDKCPKFVASLFRDNRGLHLGILAPLYVLERMGTTGITCDHIIEAIKRFGALYSFRLYGKRTSVCNPIVRADFYRKLGDILFYKNVKCDACENPAIRVYEKGIKVLLVGTGPKGYNLWRKVYDYIISQREVAGISCRVDKIWGHSLAILFESLGHACIGVSRLGDLGTTNTHLICLAKMIVAEYCNTCKVLKEEVIDGGMSMFAKGLYCYWAAAKLYDMVGESQAMGRNYKHTLSVLEIHVKQSYRYKTTLSLLEERELEAIQCMADDITRCMLRGVYASYEHCDMLEKDGFEDKLRISEADRSTVGETGKIIDDILRCLSNNIDVEEIVYAYYRLLIEYCYVDAYSSVMSIRNRLFRAWLQVPKQKLLADKTLSTLINTHRFRLNIVKFYISCLFRDDSLQHIDAPADIKSDAVDVFMADTAEARKALVKILGGEHNLNKMCNSKNIENQIVFVLNKILSDAIRHSEEVLKWMVGPLQVTTLFNHTFQGNIYSDYAVFLKLYKQLRKYAKDKDIKMDDVLDEAKASRRKLRYANEQYLAERALRSYIKVQECHQQGQAYRDLMQQLYLLEDDFNNDTIQFYLATERIGLEGAKKKERKLREDTTYSQSRYYSLEAYETPIEEV